MTYDRVNVSELDVLLHLIETIDSSAGIDRLATNSRTTGEYLRTIYGRAADRVVYPGVNLPETVSPPSSSDPLLFVGNLWQHKRIDLVIKALARLPKGRLRIVGRDPRSRTCIDSREARPQRASGVQRPRQSERAGRGLRAVFNLRLHAATRALWNGAARGGGGGAPGDRHRGRRL